MLYIIRVLDSVCPPWRCPRVCVCVVYVTTNFFLITFSPSGRYSFYLLNTKCWCEMCVLTITDFILNFFYCALYFTVEESELADKWLIYCEGIWLHNNTTQP